MYNNYTNIGLIWYINFSKYLISFNQSLLVSLLISISKNYFLLFSKQLFIDTSWCNIVDKDIVPLVNSLNW